MNKNNLYLLLFFILLTSCNVILEARSKAIGYEYLSSSENLTASSDTERVDRNKDSYAILPDYLLKPGDEINIDIWGDLNLHYTPTIDNDGYIIIPSAGRLSLNGLTYGEGKKKIVNVLGKTYSFYIDVDNPGAGKAPVDISIGRTANVHIFVTGEVNKPGNILCRGSDSSIFTAIRNAGGITSQGSVRNIKLRKVNNREYTFDLYEFLIKGNLLPVFKNLHDGDIVFVPISSNQILIKGAVKREGFYEMLPNGTLADAIILAGGFSNDASHVIKISRMIQGIASELPDINYDTSSGISLHDGDIVFAKSAAEISSAESGEVSISGEVKNATNYHYIYGEKVVDLIKRAGGLQTDAFTQGSQLIRDGRLHIIHLEKAFNDPDSDYNFTLFSGDKLIIPRVNTFIFVKGAVVNPVTVMYKKGETADYYIDAAGGFGKNADTNSVKIITSNGETFDASSRYWFFLPDKEVPVNSIIEVPEKNPR